MFFDDKLVEVSPEDHALHQANISHAHTEPSVQIRHQKRTTRQIKLPAANSTGNSDHITSEKRLTNMIKSIAEYITSKACCVQCADTRQLQCDHMISLN